MTNYELLRSELCNYGMDKKISLTFVNKLKEDEQFTIIDDEKKQWALRHGFFPGRVELYGLNDNNFVDYMPDYHYHMMHPMNHHFRIWINDKLTLKYIFNNNALQGIMPEYYAYIENDGSCTYLMDYPSDIDRNENYIMSLLQKKRELVIKPNSGTSGGFGFMKLALINNSIHANNSIISKEELNSIRDFSRNCIITEYIHQHDDLAKIWPASECTLRIIMYKNVKKQYDADNWTCLSSFARFGTRLSGGASNLSAGGIGVGFDFTNGKYKEIGYRYKKYSNDGKWTFQHHPDSDVYWKDLYVPNWDYVKEKIYEICSYISSLSYLELDIVITKDGMKLLEINTFPALDYAQNMSSPALRDISNRDFFNAKGLKQIDGEDLLKAYLLSQQ